MQHKNMLRPQIDVLIKGINETMINKKSFGAEILTI